MKQTSTQKFNLRLPAFLLVLFLSACTARVDREPQASASDETKEQTIVTLAASEAPDEEAYFDLIAETSDCLGENLWIGGKVEAAADSRTGDSPSHKVYKVKELTATGLNTNNSYTLRDSKGTLTAISDEDGNIYVQIGEGRLQLVPESGKDPIVVAYQPWANAGQAEGIAGKWSCQ